MASVLFFNTKCCKNMGIRWINDFANSIDDAIELTNWEPEGGKKGGIMIFASDDNADMILPKT